MSSSLPRRLTIALFAAALLAACGGDSAPEESNEPSSTLSSPSPTTSESPTTTTPASPTATVTPTPTSTPTSGPSATESVEPSETTTSSEGPTESPGGDDVAFADDFTDRDRGWDIGEEKTYEVYYAGDDLGIHIFDSGAGTTVMVPIPDRITVSDVRISVDTFRSYTFDDELGDVRGVACRVNGDLTASYRFVVDAYGGAAIFKEENNEVDRLTKFVEKPAIKAGNAANSIVAECRGDLLKMSVNGVPIVQKRDPNPLPAGSAALLGSSSSKAKAGTISSFDNLVVEDITEG